MPAPRTDATPVLTYNADLPAVRLVYAPLTVTNPDEVRDLERGLGKLAENYVLKYTERMHTYTADAPGQTTPSQFGLAMLWVRRDLA